MPPEEEKGENPQVIKDVKKELKSIGDDAKEFQDSINKSWNDFKAVYDEALENGEAELGQVKEKLDKHITDLTTRFEQADKDYVKRLDDLETKASRTPTGVMNTKDGDEDMDDAREFKAFQLSRKDPHFDEALLEEASVEDLKRYEAAQDRYFRKGNEPDEGIGPEDRKALQTGKDPKGGYFIKPALSRRVVKKIYESSPLRALATVEKISTDSLEVPVDINDIEAEWTSETQTPPEKDVPETGLEEIHVFEMKTTPKATEKLLEDSSFNVERWLVRKLASRFGRAEANAFITGNGVGKPRGILTYAAGTDWGKIQQIATGVSAGFDYEGIMDIYTGLKEDYHFNAKWMLQRKSLAKLFKIKDGDGSYLFARTFADNKTKYFVPSMMGYPLRMAAHMPEPAADSLSLAFGDWKVGYTIVDRLGMTILRNPYKNPPWIQFFTRRRVGGDVVNFEAFVLGKCSAA